MTDGFIKVPLVTVAGKDTDCEIISRGGVEYYRQRVETDPDQYATGTLTNLNDTITLPLDRCSNAACQISHVGWTGTITFEGTCGGGWVPLYAFHAGSGTSTLSYTNPSTGSLFRCVVSGLTQVRVRLSTIGTGTLTVFATATAATGGVFVNLPLPQGENIIGSVGTPEYAVASSSTALNGKAAELITILGYRRQWVSSTSYGDLCPYLTGGQSTMNTPNSGIVLYIASTSSQDMTAGTGVDRVRITYLNAAGIEAMMDVSLNGTTPVSIGSGNSFIQMMESWHSTIPERYAVGDIAISSVNGVATESTTVEMIRATHNRSQSGRYKVPMGRHAHIIDYHISVVKITGGGSTQHDVSMSATVFNDRVDGLSNTFRMLRGVSITDGTVFSDTCHYRYLPEGTVLKMNNKPTAIADGNIVKTSIDLLVVDN